MPGQMRLDASGAVHPMMVRGIEHRKIVTNSMMLKTEGGVREN